MATFLFRLGRAAYRRAVPVLLIWLVAAGAVLGAGLALGGKMKDSVEVPGTESQEAIDLLAAVFPQTAGASAQIVVQNPDGIPLNIKYGTQLQHAIDEITDVKGVEQASSPYREYATDAVSTDGSTVIIAVQFSEPSDEVTPRMLDDVAAAVKPLTDAGLTVAYGGQVYQHVAFGITWVEGLGVPTFGTTMRDSKAVYGPAPEYGVPVILAGTGRALTRELRDLVSEMVASLDEVAA